MNRNVWSVSAALVIVFLAAMPAPGSAISNGMIDTVHTYVGAAIVPNPDPGFTTIAPFTGHTQYLLCSGTLIAPRLFLLAAHCIARIQAFGFTPDKVFVSFATNVFKDRKSWLAVAAFVKHPGYTPTSASTPDLNDIGVLVLAKPVRGIAPVPLAPIGYLDELGKQTSTPFSLLGYGLNDTYVLTGDRRITTSMSNGLSDTWLKLTGKPGSFCRMDSGGPSLVPAQGTEYQVSLHSSLLDNPATPPCDSGGYDTRIDTKSAQAFLHDMMAKYR